jgi:hypothetical protein
MSDATFQFKFHALGVAAVISRRGLLDNRDQKTRLALVSGKSVGENLRSRLDERVNSL